MPRKGKGQKIQTATGQQYGAATEQEQMQQQAPLPEMPAPSRVRPGEMGSPTRMSERPAEPIGAQAEPQRAIGPDPQRSEKIARILPTLLPLANSPYVGDDTRSIINKMISMVPEKEL
jgi:hypothetical protein